MVTKFVEIINAALALQAADATYSVQFYYETKSGRAWEFDPNSDAIQTVSKRTGRIKVSFNPVINTIAFVKDANRPTQYVMNIEKARELYKKLTAAYTPNYWFALDCADYAERY